MRSNSYYIAKGEVQQMIVVFWQALHSTQNCFKSPSSQSEWRLNLFPWEQGIGVNEAWIFLHFSLSLMKVTLAKVGSSFLSCVQVWFRCKFLRGKSINLKILFCCLLVSCYAASKQCFWLRRNQMHVWCCAFNWWFWVPNKNRSFICFFCFGKKGIFLPCW